MSQAHRMGFEEFSRDSQISRLFVQKYFFASTGEDEGESDVGAEENLDGVRSLKILALILSNLLFRNRRSTGLKNCPRSKAT